MSIELTDNQAEQLIRLLRGYFESNEQLLREVIELQRQRFKPRKRTVVERNARAAISRAPEAENELQSERIRRLLLGAR